MGRKGEGGVFGAGSSGKVVRQRPPSEVTLKRLIEVGVLEAEKNCMLVEAKNTVRRGDLREDGTIFFEGKTHNSPSSFAVAALRSAGAKSRMSANGWQTVVFRGKPLEIYRAEFVKNKWGFSTSSASSDDNAESEQASPLSGQESGCRVSRRRINYSGADNSVASSGRNLLQRQTRSVGPCLALRDHQEAELSCDGRSADLAGGSAEYPPRKRGPKPELQMWLERVLKKRHVESQSLTTTD